MNARSNPHTSTKYNLTKHKINLQMHTILRCMRTWRFETNFMLPASDRSMNVRSSQLPV